MRRRKSLVTNEGSDDESLGFLALISDQQQPVSFDLEGVDPKTFLTPEQKQGFEAQFVQLGVDIMSTQRKNIATLISELTAADSRIAARLKEFSHHGNGRNRKPVSGFVPSASGSEKPRPPQLTLRPNSAKTKASGKSMLILELIQDAGEAGIKSAEIADWAFNCREYNTGRDDLALIRVRVNAVLQQLKKQKRIEPRNGFWVSLVGFKKLPSNALPIPPKLKTGPVKADQWWGRGKTQQAPASSGSKCHNRFVVQRILKNQPGLTVAQIADFASRPDSGYDAKGADLATMKARIGVMLLNNKKYFKRQKGSKPIRWEATTSANDEGESDRGGTNVEPTPNSKARASPNPSCRRNLSEKQKKLPDHQQEWEALLLSILNEYDWRLSFEEVLTEANSVLSARGWVVSETLIQNKLCQAVVSLQNRQELAIEDQILVRGPKLKPAAAKQPETGPQEIDDEFVADLANEVDNEGLNPNDYEEEISRPPKKIPAAEIEEDSRSLISSPEDWNEAVLDLVRNEDPMDSSDIILFFQRCSGTKNWRVPDDMDDSDIESHVQDSIEDLCFNDGSLAENEDGKLIESSI